MFWRRKSKIGSGSSSATLANARVTLSLLAVAILAPTFCVIWLIQEASRNEQLAMKQVVEEARMQLIDTSANRLKNDVAEWFKILQSLPIEERFSACIFQDIADACLVLDDEGNILYPKYSYENIKSYFARETEGERLLQRIRLAKQEEGSEAAIHLILELLADNDNRVAPLRDGRPVGPYAILYGLRLPGASVEGLETLRDMARDAALDYSHWPMGSSQRIVLLNELLKKSDEPRLIRARQAEFIAQQAMENLVLPENSRIWNNDTFIFACLSESRLVLLFEKASFAKRINALLDSYLSDSSLGLKLVQIGSSSDDSSNDVLSRNLDAMLLGWRLALFPRSADWVDASTKNSILVYSWIGALAILLSVSLAFVILYVIQRQISIARLKNDLVSTVSHELKTPVASIRLLVDTLLRKAKPDPEQTQDYLELISRENSRLGHLIENFLSFSRMERDRNSFTLEPGSAETIVAEAEAAFKDRFVNKDYELMTSVEEGLADVVVDREAMVAAIGNLLDNAYKYGGAEKRIELRARNGNNGIVFEVEDHGLGVLAKDRKRIFDSFFQGDRRLSEHRGGVGLGLSIVSFIVSKHKGRIDLESEVGKGSVFSIFLPYA